MILTAVVVLGSVALSKAETKPVTKGDIEAKLRQMQGELTGVQKAAGGGRTFAAGAVVAVVLVALAYVFGQRRGKKSRPVVEIRRV